MKHDWEQPGEVLQHPGPVGSITSRDPLGVSEGTVRASRVRRAEGVGGCARGQLGARGVRGEAVYQQRSGSGGGDGAPGVCPWRGRVWGPRGARRALASCLVLAGPRSPEAPAGGVARAGRVGVAGRARGAGGLREGGDPEGRGRARAAHARCIVLTENAVGFESGGGGAERVPPADGEADPLQVSVPAAAAGAGAGRRRPRAPPVRAPAPALLWAWVPPPGAAWGPTPSPAPVPLPSRHPRATPHQASARRLSCGRVDHHPTRAAAA